MHFYIKSLQFLLYVILTYVSKKNNLKQKIKKQKKAVSPNMQLPPL